MKKYLRLVFEVEIDDTMTDEEKEQAMFDHMEDYAGNMYLSLDDMEIHEHPYNSEYED